MAGVIITTTGNIAEIEYGDYYENSGSPYASSEVRAIKGCFLLSNIDELWIDGTDVYLRMKGMSAWRMGVVQKYNNFVVDFVNDVAPTDNNHLYTLIKSLL